MPGRTPLLALLCATAVGAAPGVRAEPEGPFRVPREEVLGQARTVALAPLWVPDELIVDRVDRKRLLDLVEERLRQAGVSIVPPARTGPVLEAIQSAQGGYLDAAGKLDLERYYAFQREAAKTLRERTGAERLLLVSLSVAEAPVAAGRAAWNGVEEDAAIPAVGRTWTGKDGKLWALSVCVWVHGEGGRLLYRGEGGLRLLFHFGRGGETVPVVDADLLADDERNARAVGLALEPLLAPSEPSRTVRVEGGRSPSP